MLLPQRFDSGIMLALELLNRICVSCFGGGMLFGKAIVLLLKLLACRILSILISHMQVINLLCMAFLDGVYRIFMLLSCAFKLSSDF